MRDRRALRLLLAPVLLLSLGARSAERMYEPGPIEIPDGASREDVLKAIERSLVARDWSVDKKLISEEGAASEVAATLYVRVHTVTIRIEFDDEQIRIHYVSSAKMAFRERKNKERFIHPKYTQWIRNLEKDLKSELLALG